MKHHFGDLLNRDKDYWTIAPNRERWAYRFEVKRARIGVYIWF